MAEKCYYAEFGTCTYNASGYCNWQCVGREKCRDFVSESEYFSRSMAGTIKENVPKEDPKVRQQRINSALSLGKTKKQQKYEARQKAEKERERDEARGLKGGAALADDPRFKDLFG